MLTFEWLSDHELRCPLFPTLWATTATLFTGRTYRVVGTVSFRDRTLAIRVLGIRESVRRHARGRLRGARRRRSSARPARRWRDKCDVSRADSRPASVQLVPVLAPHVQGEGPDPALGEGAGPDLNLAGCWPEWPARHLASISELSLEISHLPVYRACCAGKSCA